MYKKALYMKLVLLVLLLVVLISIPFRGFFGWNLGFMNFDHRSGFSGKNINLEVMIPVDSIDEIDIDFISGDIDISYYDGEEIKLQYSNNSDNFKCVYDVDGNTLKIRSDREGGNWFFMGMGHEGDLTLYLPQDFTPDFNLDTVSGDVSISTRGEKLDINAVSGDYEIANNYTEIDVNTISGDVIITADQHLTKELDVDSVSGDVILEGTGFRYQVDLYSIGGSFRSNGDAGGGFGDIVMDIEIDSVSGDFDTRD